MAPASAVPALQTTAAFTVALWLRLETVPGSALCAVSKPFGAAGEDSWQIVTLFVDGSSVKSMTTTLMFDANVGS